ncbi:MAG: Porphobilinogen deaminase [uncultured Thermomicrobiales bacterium]|uniref:Porphobilinogen deaminase n=1 Tax=uncultured Thermomicrobiales bacterium TaxID=1645740 RepID=A0A6J4URT8_9BACT|nr:MAG: Porphobilinogen deaminase [uncultured Thermomicrobiales bacterium]
MATNAGDKGPEFGVGCGRDNAPSAATDDRPEGAGVGLRPLRLGTRGSALARAQTQRVIDLLAGRTPSLPAEPRVIRTEGDVDKVSPLTLIGGRGVFTSALQEALARGEIDAAVHSAKDLPSEQPAWTALAAFPEREDPRDVLVSRHGTTLAGLPPRPIVGTSSRRRAVQVRLRRPDARIVDLRGNIDTRLRKALTTDVDAIVLAAAGVRRMGWADRVTEALPLDAFVPSPGQGALAVETRADDWTTLALVDAIDDPLVSRAVRVERAFLRAVGGGCTTPIGAHVSWDGERPRLRAMIASEDGERVEWADERLDDASAEEAAAEVAIRLLARVRAAGGMTFGYHPSPATPVRNGAHDATDRPLAGVGVLVTRARLQAAPLARALAERGAEPVLLPTIRIKGPADPAPLDAALHQMRAGGFDWVVFSSANGVDQVLERLGDHATGTLAGCGIAAVGEATAAVLRGVGIGVDLVPDESVAEGLVAALAAHGVSGQRVLYPKADRARDALPEGLRALGADVVAVDAYRTVPEPDVDPAVVARVARGGVDAVTFASPSSVRNLQALLGDRFGSLERAAVVCVGSVTAGVAREMGLPVAVVAADASVAGLVDAVVRWRWPDRSRTEPGRGAELVGAVGGKLSGRGGA